jgi:hypothetical protein
LSIVIAGAQSSSFAFRSSREAEINGNVKQYTPLGKNQTCFRELLGHASDDVNVCYSCCYFGRNVYQVKETVKLCRVTADTLNERHSQLPLLGGLVDFFRDPIKSYYNFVGHDVDLRHCCGLVYSNGLHSRLGIYSDDLVRSHLCNALAHRNCPFHTPYQSVPEYIKNICLCDPNN